MELLTRRLAECPPEFLAEPRLGDSAQSQGVHVHAVITDLMDDLGGPPLSPVQAAKFQASGRKALEKRNRLRLALIASWLCHDGYFRAKPVHAPAILVFLSDVLPPLAKLTAADLFITDQDRREELVRALVAHLGLTPRGESPAQAADRLKALSTVERARLVRETQKQEAHARKLREAMKRKAARQAAAKVQRE
ncbi:MAG: hypothetical protein D6E12_07740 [Desulfovibrio sp.]|nr:MAG: hypothetical protein D6E12_07740 [Desulfovibrio sp.]